MIQGPCVLAWVICNCFLRFLTAAFLSWILLERRVHWEAVLHPFDYDFDAVWDGHYGNTRTWRDCCAGSIISYDVHGNDRSTSARLLWLLFPPLHIFLLMVVAVRLHFLPAGPPVETAMDTYAVFFGGIASVALVVVVLAALFTAIGPILSGAVELFRRRLPRQVAGPKKEKRPSRFYLWLQNVGNNLWKLIYGPVQDYTEHRREQVHVRRREMYQELSCARVPEHGIRPMTAMTAVKFTRMPRLVFDRLKSSPFVCKPMQRG